MDEKRAIMQCPRCSEALRPGIAHVQLCPRCDGCWVDKGSLFQLTRLTREQLSQTPIEPTLVADPKPLRMADQILNCPQCRLPMKRQIYCGDSGIEVDRCPDHGMWLDDGELSQLLDYVQGDSAR